MGLDITVHTRVEPFDEADIPRVDGDFDWDWAYENGVDKAFCFQGFEQSLRPLVQDTWVRSVGKTWGFRAGSYGGYNAFREELSRLALGVEPEEVWQDPDRFRDRPFFELINFADNEGTIGSEAAADLHADFVAYMPMAVERWTDDSYDFGKYTTWTKACRDAADGGMIDFH